MIRLCGVGEIESGQARRFDVAGLRVALVRIDQDFYALGDRCSHADVSLSDGEVLVEDRQLECWKHGSTFSLETGVPSCLPANRPVPTYSVTVVDDDVFLDVQPPQPAPSREVRS